ncbi:MAG: multiheme c-type cytochrome [Desulfobulbaceae bacterium]
MIFSYKNFIILFICTVLWSFPAMQVHAAPDAPHNAANSLGCLSCHDMTSTLPNLMPPWVAHTPTDIDDTLLNSMCWSCHNDIDAPYVKTHSSLTTSDRYGDWSVECRVCHNLHTQEQLRRYGAQGYLHSAVSSGVTETGLSQTGAGWEENAFAGMLLVPNTAKVNYNYTIIGNTADTLTVKGPMDLTQTAAGDTFAVVLGKLIRSTIHPADITDPLHPEAKSDSQTVRYFRREGLNSFADGDPTFDGICEVCHTETNHFQNDGGGGDPLHDNVGSVAGTNCTTCHSHQNGFAHGGGSGIGCIECHGHDAGTLIDPDMAAPYTAGTTASPGHGTVQSHSTHTETDDDDLKGPGIYCDTCHNINKIPLFRSVADPNAELSLAETDVCDTCHSKGGTYDGLDDPVVGSKTIWKTGAYVSTSDSTLRSDKEKWCATCHDEAPSVIAGVSAPNVVGDEDGSYTYGTGWGYYKTGHGLAAGEQYPSKGGVETLAGRPISCGSCHNSQEPHVDGIARTFDLGGNFSATPPSAYRQAYRLQTVQDREPMLVPWPDDPYGNNINNYRLCVQCHDPGPFIDAGNTNTNFITDGINRHQAHLVMNSDRYAADWRSINNSKITCVACHNVHGSTRLAMVRDGSLVSQTPGISREPGLMIWYHDDPAGGSICEGVVCWNATNPDPPAPENLPLSASTGTIWRGETSTNLCSHCHHNNNTVPEYRGPYQNTAQAPTLSWTGENGYAADGSNPDSAPTGSTFTFRVNYTDANNDPPNSIEVWIDLDDNGYDPGEKHGMAEADAGDANATDGKLYTFVTVLSDIGGNTKKYRFAASDGANPATGPPTADGSVQIFSESQGSGSAPVLNWTGEPDYASDGVHPDSGQSTDSFEFRVKYTDTENDPPASIELWLDSDGNTTFSSEEKIALSKAGTGTDYIGGEIYTSGNLMLTCADGCGMAYRFHASDGSGEATSNAPVSLSRLQLGNNPPLLAWTGEPDYEDDGVDPQTAAGGSDFTFRVEYTDLDNTAPSAIQVWVDLDDSETYDDGEKIALTATDAGDGNYADGKRYATTIRIPHVGDGTINYRFHAADGSDQAIGVPIQDQTVTTTLPVNNAPSLNWTAASCLSDGVRPSIGAWDTDFEFMVEYTDPDNQCPTGANAIQVWVDIDDSGTFDPNEKYDLVEDNALDVDCADGKLYKRTMPLAVAGDGVISYRFHATDWYEAATGPPTSGGSVTVLAALKVRPGGGTYWYTSIQSAVNDSNDPDTILVWPNSDFTPATYAENISVLAKPNRTVRSVCGADLTSIASPGGNNTITFQDGGNGLLDGFSVTGAVNSGAKGIAILRADNTEIRNSNIYGNTTGIEINDSDPVTVADSKVHGNSRGIYAVSEAASIISGSEISSNSGVNDGAGIYLSGGTHTIVDSVISNNTALDNAVTPSEEVGGIYFMNTAPGTSITNTVIKDNAANGGFGGGMAFNGANALFDKCTITGNTASTHSGAMSVTNSTVDFTNSIIAGNSAGTYGGVGYLLSGNLSFTNVTFADNQASGNGGVFEVCNLTNNTVRNSIFWNNSAGGTGHIANKSCSDVQYLTITDSDVSTGTPYFSAWGSISAGNNMDPAQDPLFVGGSPFDYHILAGSPVIDQASATYAPADDIDANARPQGSGDDMGADEYMP